MSQIDDFRRACVDAGVQPVAALARAGLHRATWFRWTRAENPVSPTLRSLDAAWAALAEIKAEPRTAAAVQVSV